MKKPKFLILLFFIVSCSQLSTDKSRKLASWGGCYEELRELVFYGSSSIGSGTTDFTSANSLREMKELYGQESMFSIQGRLSSEAKDENNAHLRELLKKDPEFEYPNPEKKTSLTKAQANKVYQLMLQTPCVSNDGPYQRPNVSIGYCFGRAIVAHFHALRKGMHPEAMKKIWVVGPMHGDWGHHVALMIRGDDDNWYVIDNVTGLVTHEQWMNKIKSNYEISSDDNLMFFTTEAARFGPRKNFTYNTVNLFNVGEGQFDSFDRDADYYKGFFRDFFEWLNEQPDPELF